jgi:Fuc2NAc and GlcNAc transferase
MIVLALAGILATVAGYLLTHVVLRSSSAGMLDVPNGRSLHTAPKPRGGGLSIVVIATMGALGHAAASGQGEPIAPLLAGGLLIAAVGLRDDIRAMAIRYRLVVHALAAIIALGHYGWWRSIALPGDAMLELGWLGAVLTFLWITGMTNAYNFMDGIDGIAGGQALVGGLAWAALGTLTGSSQVALFGALIAGSSAGFLRLNWAPARIFMGDVGSTFLGYAFAVMPLVVAAGDARGPWIAVLVAGPIVFDATFTILRRIVRRENILRAHRSHLYQRLVVAGHAHASVSAVYMALALILSVLACVIWIAPEPGIPLALLFGVLLSTALWVRVVVVERDTRASSLTAQARSA